MASSRSPRSARRGVLLPLPVGRAGPRERRLPPLWTLPALLLGAFLLLPPLALLVGLDAAALSAALARPDVGQAVRLSLATSAVALALTLGLGTPLAWLLARGRFPLRRVLDTLVDLPMVLPPAVAGVALLMAFGRRGLAGGLLDAWDLHLAFTPAAVVLAQVFVSAPLYVRAAVIGFSDIDPDVEAAALTDGASAWGVLRHVTLPLARRALVSGAVLSWARAVGEFGATLLFAGNFPGRTQTMPLAIYLGFEMDLSVALSLSVLLLAGSFAALVTARRFLL